MTLKLGLDAYDDNIKIWKGLVMPLILHIHIYGRNALSESVLFCLMTYGYRKMRFYTELQNYYSFCRTTEMIVLPCPDSWRFMARYFSLIYCMSFSQDHTKSSFPWKDSTVKVGSDWAAAFGNLLELRQFWMKVFIWKETLVCAVSKCVCVGGTTYWEYAFMIILMLLF